MVVAKNHMKTDQNLTCGQCVKIHGAVRNGRKGLA